MASDLNKISRSPTPPEPDDDGEEWPVHGIVGEDVDVFGISSYEIRWQNWTRPDGTNTTWMRDIEGDPAIIASWNEAMKYQRLEKAMENQSIDLISLASTPMHDRLTFECAQAVEEKMAERLRKGAPGKVYQGWMAEIDRKVGHHHERRGERKSPLPSRKRKRPPHDRAKEASSHAESSRSAASRNKSRKRPAPVDVDGETSTASEIDVVY